MQSVAYLLDMSESLWSAGDYVEAIKIMYSAVCVSLTHEMEYRGIEFSDFDDAHLKAIEYYSGLVLDDGDIEPVKRKLILWRELMKEISYETFDFYIEENNERVKQAFNEMKIFVSAGLLAGFGD